MASDRSEIYQESFNLNFNCSTSESSFEEFQEYEVSFRRTPTNLSTISDKNKKYEIEIKKKENLDKVFNSLFKKLSKSKMGPEIGAETG